MGWVLRWMCFVFGSVALLLSGLLIANRTTQLPTTILVNLQGEPSYSPAWFVPDMPTPRPLREDLGSITDVTLHPDGSVAFLSADLDVGSDQSTIGVIYRTHPDSLRITRLTAFPTWQGGYAWTLDSKWLVYSDVQANIEPDLYRVRDDGGDLLNLTANLNANVWAGPDTPPLISADNEWIIFSAFDNTLNETHIYRVRLAGGEPEILTGELQGEFRARLWLGDWILVEKDRQWLAWLKPDGSELVELPSTIPAYSSLRWSSKNQLLFLSHGYSEGQIVAIHPGEATPLWVKTPPARFNRIWLTLDEQWIVWGHDDGTWYRMRPNGTGQVQILTVPKRASGYGISPENQLLLVPSVQPGRRNRLIQQTHILTDTVETLATISPTPSMRAYEPLGWSPDGKSLIYQIYFEDTIQIFRVNLATGRSEALTDGTQNYAFAGWGPTIGRDWSAGHMGIIGAAFGLIALLPYRKIFHRP